MPSVQQIKTAVGHRQPFACLAQGFPPSWQGLYERIFPRQSTRPACRALRFAPSLSFSRPLLTVRHTLFTMLPGIKLFELTNRVAIITGGSKDWVRRWAPVWLVLAKPHARQSQCRGSSSRRGQNRRRIRLQGDGFAADVSKQADMEAMVAKCLEEFGRIDILVNSAVSTSAGQSMR